MAQLSVIIVNYNVAYFLEQALRSVYAASQTIDTEIFVVDNASSDGSVQMVKEHFPSVHLIENKENVGFSKANNQAIKKSSGQYVLLLNPDTIVQEDTFSTCLNYMETHEETGAVGVRMVDGSGTFLPESKRGLPTPWVSLAKMTGLSKLFPKSALFGRYHLGFLDDDKNHDVEVLSGAFFLARGPLLRDIGGFDERFFMYGEDIDLSYRILMEGYKNTYLADTQIIHYKGESTKKNSLNYVRIFYKAMALFAQKHYPPLQSTFYKTGVYVAMLLHALITTIKTFVQKLWHPSLDTFLILLSLWGIKNWWAIRVKGIADYYPEAFSQVVLPLYAFTWVLAAVLTGAYLRPYKSRYVLRAVGLGTLLIAAIYGFLPEPLRFSRAIILLGALSALCVLLLTRLVYNAFKYKQLVFEYTRPERCIIVGKDTEANRVLQLLRSVQPETQFLGFVHPLEESGPKDYLGRMSQLDDLVRLYDASEVIFCQRDVPARNMINFMTRMGQTCKVKLVSEEGNNIIGSSSKNSNGQLYGVEINLRLNDTRYRLYKWILDRALALLFLFTLPLCVWFVDNKGGFIANCLAVLQGRKTWVGYIPMKEKSIRLPQLPPSVITPFVLVHGNLSALPKQHLNVDYARNYSIARDIHLMQKGFRHLGTV